MSPETEKKPDESKQEPSSAEKLRQTIKQIMVILLVASCGVLLGLLFNNYILERRRIRQQQEQPEQPPPPIPTPTPQAPPQSEEPIQESQQPLQVPINPSEEQITCLRYGGGAECFSQNYQPDLPESQPRQLPPSLPDLPDVSPENELDLENIPIAVISGREVPNWQPNYSLRPMQPGVCPPSWVITYQNRLFCGRRPIFEPPEFYPRF